MGTGSAAWEADTQADEESTRFKCAGAATGPILPQPYPHSPGYGHPGDETLNQSDDAL